MVKLNLLYGLIGTAVIGGAGSAGVYYSLRQSGESTTNKNPTPQKTHNPIFEVRYSTDPII